MLSHDDLLFPCEALPVPKFSPSRRQTPMVWPSVPWVSSPGKTTLGCAGRGVADPLPTWLRFLHAFSLYFVSPLPHRAAVWRHLPVLLSSERGATTMGKFRDDPEFWRQHAEDVRIKSELENCPGSRRAAQEIASQYDLIACRVEERTKGLEKRAPAPSALHRHAIRQKRDQPRYFTHPHL
jgi:hypothetical protein